jgi:oligosaccharide amylase
MSIFFSCRKERAGMPKSYFNNAVIGNSSMLGCITESGELTRLYWPQIDFPQHIEKLTEGLHIEGSPEGTLWLDSGYWERKQKYIKDTNILETVHTCTLNRCIEICRTDFVLPDEDVLIRKYDFGNLSEEESLGSFCFLSYSSFLSTNADFSSTLFDFELDSLIHYKHGSYFLFASDVKVDSFQLGNDALEAARRLDLKSNDQIGMMHDAALSWRLGGLKPGETRSLTLYICAADTIKGARRLGRSVKSMSSGDAYSQTHEYWTGVLGKAAGRETRNQEANELYRRSVLLFKLMSDKKSGGLLASPEIDEEFTRCGRYAFCWGRDAAFITGALDACGLHDDVDSFYRWAANVQEDNGSWQQRYHLDGNLAPSWGLQIDETGTLLWGILQHYKVTGDKGFLEGMWECMKKGMGFLLGFIDEETGLPYLSFDLWEERFGEHAYSSAAVYGGIMACAEAADILGDGLVPAEEWRQAAEGIREAIERNFWKQDWNRFIRSVRVKLNPWGDEGTCDTVLAKINPMGYRRDFTKEDWKVDASLLGLSVPFNVYISGDPKMEGTLDVVEKVLLSTPSGGLKRYENDCYIGGNPWIITTLWAALYHIEKGSHKKALEYFEWALKTRTELGLLPEQADNVTGKAAWVVPLTWSHAMFILVMDGLEKAGMI